MSNQPLNTKFWDKTARKYAKNTISDMAGYEKTLARTRHWLKPGDKAYEFGCGTGTTALKLAASVSSYTATDISTEMITIAREKAASENLSQLSFETGEPSTANFSPASVDVVLGFNILHLIENRQAVLQRIHQMLKPDGLLISKTPCLGDANPIFRVMVPIMQWFGKAPYVAFFTIGELKSEIIAAGFEIVETEFHASKGKDSRPFIVAKKK